MISKFHLDASYSDIIHNLWKQYLCEVQPTFDCFTHITPYKDINDQYIIVRVKA